MGDPIEAQALLATYGQGRGAVREPLWLGSVKSNIGHTQAAAGVAGVIKMVLAMRHGVLPRTLHVDEPSPHVDWSSGAVELLSEAREWPECERPRRAGVSSFGISGTNAHVIVEQAPAEDEEAATAPDTPGVSGVSGVGGLVPWVVSGRSVEGLRGQAARLGAWALDREGVSARDVGWSLASGRAVLEHRAVVWGRDVGELVAGLAGVESGGVAGEVSSPVFVFPGQGSQWVGMAAGLLECCPVFAAAVQECAVVMDPLVGWSLLEVLRDSAGELLERVDVVQPVLFAVMVGLARWWESCGVRPAAVIGHSQGEIAAACVAGVLSLEDAVRVVVLRSGVLRGLPVGGGMVSVGLSADVVRERIAAAGVEVSVAAVNGPGSVVLSGDVEALREVVGPWESDGVRVRWIPVDYASHSPQMELLQEEVEGLLAEVSPRPGRVPVYSTVTGQVLSDATVMDGGYWFTNLRQTVELQAAVSAAVADGHTAFVECSPHPGLVVPVSDTLEGLGIQGVVVETLRRGQGGAERLAQALTSAFVQGLAVDWAALFKGSGARRVELPTYAFQRRRYWLDEGVRAGDPVGLGLVAAEHPLLGAAVELAGGQGRVLTGRVSLASHAWLADHAVLGTVIVPGTVFLDLALRAGADVGCPVVEELTLHAPLVMPETAAVQLQVTVGAGDEAGVRSVTIHSRHEGAEEAWTQHATGTLTAEPIASEDTDALATWPPTGATPIEVDGFYTRLAAAGVDYGPAFQGVRAAWRQGDELFAEVALDTEREREARGFGVHPALLDAAVQVLRVDPGSAAEEHDAQVAFSWRGVRLHTPGAVRLRVRLLPSDGDSVAMWVADEAGGPVARIEELAVRPISAEQLRAAGGMRRDSLFRIVWRTVQAERDEAPRLALIGTGEDPGPDIRERHPSLSALGAALESGAALPDAVVVRPGDPADLLLLAHTWLGDDRFSPARLLVLTEQAVAVDGDQDVPERPDLGIAPALGVLHAAQAEYPGRIVLVDAEAGGVPPEALRTALATGEPRIAVRGGQTLAPRLTRVVPADSDAGETWGAEGSVTEGTVLVNGVDGGLTASLTRHLVTAHGIRHVTLVPRGGAEPEVRELVTELDALGVRASMATGAPADRDAMAELLAEVSAQRPLIGVVHASDIAADGPGAGSTSAGGRPPTGREITDDGAHRGPDQAAGKPVAAPAEEQPQQREPEWQTVLAGAYQARYLHELTEDLPLLFFITLSSAAGLLGAAGQGFSTAASAAHHALAAHRRAKGLPATALSWGPLDDQAPAAAPGILPIGHEQALDLFDAALAAGDAVLLTAPLDLAALRKRSEQPPALLRDLLPPRGTPETSTLPGEEDAEALKRRLAGLTEEERERVLLGLVRTHAAAVLGHSGTEEIGPERAFKEVGFDSLTAVELRNRLTRCTGARLRSTLVFDFPTAARLAHHLNEQLTEALSATAPMLAELDRLGAVLPSVLAQDGARDRVAARLRQLLSLCEDSTSDSAGLGDEAGDDLGSASDDELFSMIDQGFE
ncbi:type I polyketide synthase [Streptomyces palmae]